ncbi:MAG: hypothetical protein ACLRFI_00040 [Alphaproteobacteria bacterium]
MALFYIPVVIPADGAVSRTNPDNKNVVAKTNRSLSRVVQESKNGQNQNVNHSVVSRSVRNNVSERQNTAVVSRSGEKARNMSSRNADKITNRRDNVSKTETNKVFGARNVGIISRPVNSKDGTENILDKKITIRAAQKQLGTAAEITKAKEILEQTAELNKSCQEQYNECMDQFCAVVDAQQKRCSCSANLSKYTKVEEAVNNANTSLNEVAQRIRYVGLSADEIRAIMNATEAEEALDDNKDKSETRDMLNDIEKMIQDPTISASYTAENDTLNLLDIDFSEDSTDIFNLDFLGAESSNISNKRGKSLYDVAVKRCKTILNNCENVGATSDQITGNYDLAIDKDCIAYEQGLQKMNEKLLSNVRSANSMLQKARLSVMQNKTQYNMTECVGALENCMKDEMVCGDNYFKCIDPTKKYIDENGSVIYGQNITMIQDFMKNYNNASINSSKLSDVANISITESDCKADSNNDGSCIIKYLLDKIGTGATYKDGGLCRPVLDKCQQYTYKDDKYLPYNDVVVNYIQRAIVSIRAAQYKINSDYASTCLKDVATCYNNQISQINSWSSNATISSIKNVMVGACRNVALTCAYSVLKDAPGTSCTEDEENDKNACIDEISEIFYQSLGCPANSTYDATGVDAADVWGTIGGWVNSNCKCDTGYSVYNGSCVVSCLNNQYRENGICKTCAGTISVGTDNKENDGCTLANCPVNSTYDASCKNADAASTQGGCVTTNCRCKSLYKVGSYDNCERYTIHVTPDIPSINVDDTPQDEEVQEFDKN